MKEEKRSDPGNKSPVLKTAVDVTLKIGLLLLVLFFCFRILQPFVNILLWALVISIIEYPLFSKLSNLMGNRPKIAAILITLLFLAMVTVPGYWLVDSLIEGLRDLGEDFRSGNISVPPPSEKVSEWPFIGAWIYDKWMHASESLSSFLREILPRMGSFGEKVFNSLAGTGLGILQFAVSIIIAGIFLMWSDSATVTGKKFFAKLIGERGEEFVSISQRTIRNVATGVIGVALIQTILIGVALVVTGVPMAGVWIVLVLILVIAQIPVLLVTLPIILYMFAFKNPLPAILWTVYLVVVSLIDNFLKPVIMGQGSSIPMLLIFLGAIGGFIAYGFLGLFLGAIIISVSYKLYLGWLET
ncbi:MAG: AI-2E family transporter [Bacteroidales bacterium]|nr:AI-2E family transporter [Bacteroidales bacterium]MBN2698586.1 AI-2E family transporter [Bacteroidales bacterium]